MKNRILFSFTKSVKRIITVSMAAVLALALFGCVPARPEDANVFELYFVNNAETGVVAVDYEIQSNLSDTEDVVEEVIEQLSTEPERRQYQAPISQEVSLMDYSIADKLLTLNFDNKYYEIRRTAEILDRAAIVRTFTQLEEVEYVSFQVEGSPLLDHNGNIVGNMSADMFIYNMGHEISTYEKIELKLYFANETRDKLVPVYRSVVYNSNVSMERIALEQLILGPNTDICYPTISVDTKINSVNVKDGVCYVDFDSSLLSNSFEDIRADVAIYSIVNTIAEFADVNKVSLSVNGESSFTYRDFDVSGLYERNLDIIE